MPLNICYPNIANQTTPRRFGPLFNPCDLPKDVKERVSEADQCWGEDSYQERLECMKTTAKMKYLGAGIHRVGFAHNGCVVKVALGPEGVQANKGEYEAWQQVGRHFKNVFAPIHDHARDFFWITQPRLVPISDMPDDRRSRLKQRVEQKMDKRGVLCEDIHTGNIGVKKGGNDPYLFDFGFGLSCQLRRPDGSTTRVEVRGAGF